MSEKTVLKRQRRESRRRRIRARVNGTPSRPRLSVHRSNKHLRAQLIDDTKGITIASVTTESEKGSFSDKVKASAKKLASMAKEKNIDSVVFDRGGFEYTGNIKIFADVAREAGLKF